MASGRPGSSSGGPGSAVARLMARSRPSQASTSTRSPTAWAAAAPSSASSLSSSADEAPLTPIAPTTSPSCTIGIPPCSGTARARCSAEARPPDGLVLEVLARPAVDRRRAGLVGRDVDARDLRGVGAVEVEQLAARVDDGGDGRDTAPLRLGARGRRRRCARPRRSAPAPSPSRTAPRRRRSRSPRPRPASRRSCRSRRRPRRRRRAGCRR